MTLAATRLSASYGQLQVLHDISFSVKPGTIHALLGRNGAGKTTTLRAIFGLLDHCAGTIEVGGMNIVGLPPHRINRLGMALVPEYRGIFEGLSALDNLRLAETRGSAWTIDRVLELFPPLKSLLDRKGSHLSGGEQQMLAIGRALMSDPKFLLLDEPSQGLAPLVTDLVMQTLGNLKAQGLGILLVEQNAHAALRIADDTSVLDQGEIVFRGTPRDLLSQPDLVRRTLEAS